MSKIDPKYTAFSAFLQLERSARHAEDLQALRYVMVNETRRLAPYRRAVIAGVVPGRRMRVEAVSGIPVVEKDAPFTRLMNRVLTAALRRPEAGKPAALTPSDTPGVRSSDWQEHIAAHAAWVPLNLADGTVVAALLIDRDTPFADSELVLLHQLTDCYAHAWSALKGRSRARPGRRWGPVIGLSVAAALVAAMFIPVRLTALGPAEVVAADPLVVAAPLEGVIGRFAVEPNQPVRDGQELFRFDDTNLRAQLDVAERTLGIAEAELRRATQGAFVDTEAGSQIAILDARLTLRRSEVAFAQAQLERSIVRAERDGIAVFTDVNDWVGRPVVTGERVMLIADPLQSEVEIQLPVEDAVALDPGAPVELYLDVDPLTAIPASLRSASYEARATPEGTFAYELKAAFTERAEPVRIGLKGTAKLFAHDVPLYFYLFRRPIGALRQMLGL